MIVLRGRGGIFASWLVGFMAGAWPVGGLLPLALLGCHWRLWNRDLKLVVLLCALAVTRGVWHIRVGHTPLLAIAEIGLMWLIYQGQRWIKLNYSQVLPQAIIWGLVVTAVWSVIQVAIEPLQWIKSNQIIVQRESNGATQLIPLNRRDSSVQQVLGLRGP